ncbi:uncharacterized protein MAM_06932 [Metarhizium album ARSEF 1941]|uniref:Fibronectin type III-like domain-containing protein n=1 Tax=Metarhizium album (strain ARSEF 1941) TaxID=1081103 RepID=A0A0B2WGU1_METAS|nr:uncharacterized protein MAM_06932 [Metarhizium album ARSEF 1941]KHN95221.1 hypothetical protein MAM_06932 [Metarhizium album ARSEF 1941]
MACINIEEVLKKLKLAEKVDLLAGKPLLVKKVSGFDIKEHGPEREADTPETAALLRRIGNETILLVFRSVGDVERGKVTAALKVKNTGRTKGAETARCTSSLSKLPRSTNRPVKELHGFARVELEAGEYEAVISDSSAIREDKAVRGGLVQCAGVVLVERDLIRECTLFLCR